MSKRSRSSLRAVDEGVKVSTHASPAPASLWADAERLVAHPEQYVAANEDAQAAARDVLKRLYDHALSLRLKNVRRPSKALGALIVDGLDSDQIWEELQLWNEPLLNTLEGNVDSRLARGELSSEFEKLLKHFGITPEMERKPDQESDENSEVDFSVSADEESFGESEEEEESMEFEMDEEAGVLNLKTKRNVRVEDSDDEEVVVEGVDLPPDPYYIEEDVEKFVELADLDDQGEDVLKIDSDDEEQAMALLYGDVEDESEEGLGFDDMDDEAALDRALGGKKRKGEARKVSAREAKYSDWFQPPPTVKPLTKRTARDLFLSEEDGEGDDAMDVDVDESKLTRHEKERRNLQREIREAEAAMLAEDGKDQLSESNFEKSKKKLQAKVDALEEANMGPKAWPMRGEITAVNRPVNSLLEEELDFDFGARPAPVITEEITRSLEDLIKYRIKEGAFDDVIPPRNTEQRGDRREMAVELDSNKSKKSLAMIYEEEYQRDVHGVEKDDPKAAVKDELGRLFKAIVFKLDALSNFHATPRKTKDELNVRALKPNISAIDMEEVTPGTVSDAAMLAPEEIYSKKRKPIVGEGEMTHEDRRRERREKKAHKKAVRVRKESERTLREKREREKNGEVVFGMPLTTADTLDLKKPKGSVKTAVEKIKESGARNVNFAKGTDTTNYGQSSALFQKLQAEAEREARGLKADKERSSNGAPAKKKSKRDESASKALQFRM